MTLRTTTLTAVAALAVALGGSVMAQDSGTSTGTTSAPAGSSYHQGGTTAAPATTEAPATEAPAAEAPAADAPAAEAAPAATEPAATAPEATDAAPADAAPAATEPAAPEAAPAAEAPAADAPGAEAPAAEAPAEAAPAEAAPAEAAPEAPATEEPAAEPAATDAAPAAAEPAAETPATEAPAEEAVEMTPAEQDAPADEVPATGAEESEAAEPTAAVEAPAAEAEAAAEAAPAAAHAAPHIEDIAFSFEGPFGKFDQFQLQRGLQVYTEVCSACHGLRYVPIRTLGDAGGPGLPEDQVKAYAANLTIMDPETGEERPRTPTDHFPTIPHADGMGPDLSLMAKARAGFHGPYGSGMNQLFRGIGGPEYIHAVLTGYDGESKEEAGATLYHNKAFASGYIQMPPPLMDDQITYEDGTPATVDQMARDVSAFLMWTAEPKLMDRKQVGFVSVLFLIVMASLLYMANKRLWWPVKHNGEEQP